MKRFLAMMLSILLVCSMAVPAVHAVYEESFSTLNANKTRLLRGQTITVTASLENTEKINLATVAIFYDEEVFELVGGECLVSGTMMGLVSVPSKAGTMLMSAETAVSGDIFSFELKVKEEAPLGAAEISQRTSIGVGTGTEIASAGISFEIVECAAHIYEQQVISDKYKAGEANFSQAASYYYSCACGAKGQELFTVGEPVARPEIYGELCVENDQIKRGETVTVIAKLANTDKINLATVALDFDEEVFELVGGECLVSGTMMGIVAVPNKAGTMLMSAETAVSGDIFSFKLKVKENAPFGIAAIDQRTAIGVGTGVDIAAGGINLNVVCDHVYGEWTCDEELHSAVCTVCGNWNVGEHTFSDWTDNGENHVSACSVCGQEKTEAHAFELEVAAAEYMVSEATCTAPATYCKSCACGARGEETFTCGEKLPHTFDQLVCSEAYLVSEATCTEAAVYYYSCACGEKGTETASVGEPLGHEFESCVCVRCSMRMGDVDCNGALETADVVTLLLHISMPDMFPVGDVVVDFDKDGAVTTADAVQLLLHISMPDMFPLQ